MKKLKSREEILEEIEELEEQLDELDDEEELEEYRENWRAFAKQFKIMQEETGFSKEECLELIKESVRSGRY